MSCTNWCRRVRTNFRSGNKVHFLNHMNYGKGSFLNKMRVLVQDKKEIDVQQAINRAHHTSLLLTGYVVLNALVDY